MNTLQVSQHIFPLLYCLNIQLIADSTMTVLFYLSSPRDREKNRSVVTFVVKFS